MGKTIKCNIPYTVAELKALHLWEMPWVDLTIISLRPVRKNRLRRRSRRTLCSAMVIPIVREYFVVKYKRPDSSGKLGDEIFEFNLDRMYSAFGVMEAHYNRLGRLTELEKMLK